MAKHICMDAETTLTCKPFPHTCFQQNGGESHNYRQLIHSNPDLVNFWPIHISQAPIRVGEIPDFLGGTGAWPW